MAVHCLVFGEETVDRAILAGRKVLVAQHRGETPLGVHDWLHWHRDVVGADAAVLSIGADAVQTVAAALAPLAERMEIVLITGLAGPAPFEPLRRGSLADAAAILSLTIADLVQPGRGSEVFDLALAHAGRMVVLKGMTVFPRRLRGGKPAHHADHIAICRSDRAEHFGWCVALDAMPDTARWVGDRLLGMEMAEEPLVPFRRAAGVARPGVPVGQLVRKGHLVDDAGFAAALARVFGGAAQAKAAEDKGGVTIVTAMKNEGPFILDWVAHHRAIGIERFLVYTNDCDDGTDKILDGLAGAGVVRRDNPYRDMGKVPQFAAFRAAVAEPLVREADWLLTLDVDEYINIHVGEGRISDLFAAVPGADLISMPWRLFGNSDLRVFEDRPVADQFTRAAIPFAARPWQGWAFKTLYRNTGAFRRMGVHRPKGLEQDRQDDLRWVDGCGRLFPQRLWRGGWRMTLETWGYDLVSINHYAVRSAESFLVKRARGRVNHVGRDQGTAYWFRMNHNVVEDHSILRYRDRVAEERARLAALPGVGAAHDGAVAWHRRRIAELKTTPDMAVLFDEITGARMQALSRLTPNFGNAVYYLGPEVIPDEVAARDPGERFYFTVRLPTNLPLPGGSSDHSTRS